MKLCLLLQRNFAYIGHNLAVILKEKYGISEFCGYVFLRHSYNFLKTQTEINYTSLLLDEEIHKEYKNVTLDLDYLKKLETDYGVPNLWPYITVDRVVMFNQLVREYPYDTSDYTHEDMLKLVQVKAKAVIKFLDEEKPDFLFCSAIGGIGSLLLYHIAKKRGIKILHTLSAGMSDTFVLSEQYDYFTDVEKMFAKRLQEKNPSSFDEQAKKFLENFRVNPAPYNQDLFPSRQPLSRMRQFKFLIPKNLYRSVSYFMSNIVESLTSEYRHDYTYISAWHYFKDRTIRKLRNLVGNDDLYDDIDPNDQYVFFPLHYEPEIYLLLLAPFHTNQIEVIRHLAYALPVGYKLYVKEHPLMVPFRPRSYYHELKKIPNVKLIRPTVVSFTLMFKAALVATITGTAGWEACFLKKPVIAFGNIFYRHLPFVKQCDSYARLPWLVKEQLENFHYDEDTMVAFLSTIMTDSVVVPLDYLWEKETDMRKRREGLTPLADLMAKKMGLLKS